MRHTIRLGLPLALIAGVTLGVFRVHISWYAFAAVPFVVCLALVLIGLCGRAHLAWKKRNRPGTESDGLAK